MSKLAEVAVCAALLLSALFTTPTTRAERPGPAIIQGPPPGWEIVKITDDPELDEHVAMNNIGQIVFSKRMPDSAREEIFLYDNGKLRRLTFDNFQDQGARINDNGTIVWYRQAAFAGDDTEVFRWRDGVIEQLTDNDVHDARPDIADTGLIMWSRGPTGEMVELVQYRDGIVTQVTNNGLANACVRINEDEDYAWIAYDFSVEPSWRSTILCFVDGATHELTDGTTQAQGCTISDDGVVGWHQNGLKRWNNGITTAVPFTGFDDRGPLLNNGGDLMWPRWTGEFWTPFLERGENRYQLTNSAALGISGADINDLGEVSLELGDLPEKDIWLMWRVRAPGDFTGDGRIDRFDFESMQNCMSNVACGVRMPPVCLDIFDLDLDGDIDFRDFAVFQRLVIPVNN